MKLFILLFFSISLLYSQSNFENIKVQYFKSYDYEQMGKYTEAIKVLSPLYKQYPKGYTLNLRFGWLFFLNKKYPDAIKYYKQASLSNSYALDPRLGLIQIYLTTGDFEQAETVSYELLKIDFYNYYANLYVTRALIAQGKYEVATKIILKMLALYPTDIMYLEQLAVVYKNTDSKYLPKLYEDILILDPNNVYVRSEMK